MKRKRSKIANFLQYIGLKILVAFIRLIPLHTGVLVLKSLAYVFYLFDRKQRKIAYENLRIAYGDGLVRLSDKEDNKEYLSAFCSGLDRFC